MKRKPTAFTLVELLVVITIIGMLVALLVPAVISARETARRGVCVNRLKELGTATIHYDSVKGQLPGWTNRAPLNGTKQINWVIALLPYLDREDLWQEWRDGSGDAASAVVYEQVCCPSDMGNLINPTPLNYVANDRLFEDRFTTAKSRTLEGLQSTQRTVMFSERVYEFYPVGPWADPDTYIAYVANVDRLTFLWPDEGKPDETVTVYELQSRTKGISSNHSGTVNIAFADGHVETVAQDTMTDVFLCGEKKN